MEKIDFINNSTPALNARNLNKLQDNIEDTLEEAIIGKGNLIVQSIKTSNLFDFKSIPTRLYNTQTSILQNGVNVTITSGGTNRTAQYRIIDLTDYAGKTITLTATVTVNSSYPAIAIGTCDANFDNRSSLAVQEALTNGRYSVSATIPSVITDTNRYLFVSLTVSRSTSAPINSGADFTNIQLNFGNNTTYYPYIDFAEKQDETYSTTETRIGTFMGKPLYQRVFTGTSSTSSSSTTVSPSTSFGNNVVVEYSGYIEKSTGAKYPIPSNTSGTTTGSFAYPYQNSNNGLLLYISDYNTNTYTYYLIVKYIKTTD